MRNPARGEQKSRKETACSVGACPEELASLGVFDTGTFTSF